MVASFAAVGFVLRVAREEQEERGKEEARVEVEG